MSEGKRIVLAPIVSPIIVGSSADRLESGRSIHLHGRIAVPNFEVDPGCSGGPGAIDEMIEQEAANASPLMIGRDRQKQQLGFAGYRPEQREADRQLVAIVVGEHQ